MTIDIRQSPSGPIVASFGDGFMTRRKSVPFLSTDPEGRTELPGDQSFYFPNVPQFLELPDPSPDRFYTVGVSVCIASGVIAPSAECGVRIEFSNDGGSNWNELLNQACPLKQGTPTSQTTEMINVRTARASGGIVAPGQPLRFRASFNAYLRTGGAPNNTAGVFFIAPFPNSGAGGLGWLEVVEELGG